MLKHHQLSSRDSVTNAVTPLGSFLSSDGAGGLAIETVDTPKAIIDEDVAFWDALGLSLDSIVRQPSSAEILAAKTATKMNLADILGYGTIDL